MNSVRRVATALAATAVLSLVASTAPAQADITWGDIVPAKSGTASR